jgi:hypothetical protein
LPLPVHPGWRSDQDRGRSTGPDVTAAYPTGLGGDGHLDDAVTDFGGIALRYGGFYGAANDGWAELVRKRMLPIIGDGGGYISWIHVEDAAAATVLALEHEGRRSTTSSTTNLRRCANACPCLPSL